MQATYDVKMKLGKGVCTLKAGTTITDIQDFAGRGHKRGIDVEQHLVTQNKGTAVGEWTKVKGTATVTLQDGKVRTVELHWFEHEKVGQVSMKVKYFKKETK